MHFFQKKIKKGEREGSEKSYVGVLHVEIRFKDNTRLSHRLSKLSKFNPKSERNKLESVRLLAFLPDKTKN